MAEERTTGLILRTRLLTETSLIVHWLTPDMGRISTVAKGARRPKSPYRGKLDLFYLADFSFSRSARSELHNLREAMLRETHARLREDFTKLHQASYATALIEHATETETPIREIFELMMGFVGHVSEHAPKAASVFAFELKLLQELGLAPELSETRLRPETLAAAEQLVTSNWAEIAAIELPHRQQEELRQFLHGFLIFHLGKIPRGRTEAIGAS
jgi:DNA repair protein RecO (recombination protein O)